MFDEHEGILTKLDYFVKIVVKILIFIVFEKRTLNSPTRIIEEKGWGTIPSCTIIQRFYKQCAGHIWQINGMLDDREQFRMMQHHTESIIIDSKAKYSIFVILTKSLVKLEKNSFQH